MFLNWGIIDRWRSINAGTRSLDDPRPFGDLCLNSVLVLLRGAADGFDFKARDLLSQFGISDAVEDLPIRSVHDDCGPCVSADAEWIA